MEKQQDYVLRLKGTMYSYCEKRNKERALEKQTQNKIGRIFYVTLLVFVALIGCADSIVDFIISLL